MTFALSTPITGAAQTGFTAPTYTLISAQAPDVNAKQWAVSALGGTQAGVDVHSVARPFTITGWIPRFFKSLGKPNPTTGLVSSVPMNSYKVVGRKGVLPLAGQPNAIAVCTVILDIPAGSDVADAANIKGLLSAVFGAVAQQSAGLGDMALNGVL
jgi:hypothetical protein